VINLKTPIPDLNSALFKVFERQEQGRHQRNDDGELASMIIVPSHKE
jgi:hypothetical protein